jgi:tetratricopeptide (TPR) repeat protein
MKNTVSFTLINGEMPMMKNLFYFIFICVFFCSETISAQENYNALVYDGNQDYKAEKYEKASSRYLEAIQLNEKDFASHYNLGNSLYKRKQYDQADAEYKKAEALAKTTQDKMASLYNQGNVQMQKKQPEKAAEFYKKALKIDPYNESVRKNYEIALLKNNEQQKQNSNQNKNNSKDQKGDKDQNKGQENGENPEQNKGGNQKNESGEGKGNQEKQNGTQNGMSKELQNAILDRVGDKEKNTTRKILNKNAYSLPESNEKDW